MKTRRMYEVWWSRGDGSHRGPSFPCLTEALEFVAKRAGEASFAIRQPNLSWFRNTDGTTVFSRWYHRAA